SPHCAGCRACACGSGTGISRRTETHAGTCEEVDMAQIGVVVVTHGQLATELLNAAETIVGDLPNCAAVSIGWHDDVEQARTEIADTIARMNTGHGVIVATDMFGGTPSNLAMTLLE